MIVIGLCGNSGSGKSTVAECVRQLNIPVIDADLEYAEVLTNDQSYKDRLVEAFSSSILNADGTVDRKRLANAVFSGEEAEAKRELLNSLSHPFVIARMKASLSEYQKKGVSTVVVDVPLLFESGFDGKCDYVVCVVAKKEVKIERIMLRDNITRELAEARISSQSEDDFLISHSDFVIENNGSKTGIQEKINNILQQIKENE